MRRARLAWASAASAALLGLVLSGPFWLPRRVEGTWLEPLGSSRAAGPWTAAVLGLSLTCIVLALATLLAPRAGPRRWWHVVVAVASALAGGFVLLLALGVASSQLDY